MTRSSRGLAFSVLAAAVLFAGGCEEKIKPSVLTSVDSWTIPSQESWNSRITISDSGRIHAIIHAGYFRTFEQSRKTAMSEGVTVWFYDQDGNQTSVLTSDEGAVDEGSNDLEAHRNVVVRSPDSTILRTERLYWSDRRQLIHTPDFVRISSPREKLQGHGFESDQSLKNYRIFRVTGEARTQ